jgi:uncharacterized protein
MALAGNCGYGAIARLGGGDLRSFVIVLVMGISAYATISGPFAWARVALFPIGPGGADVPGMAHALGEMTQLPVSAIGIAIGLLVVGIALTGRNLRSSKSTIIWSVVVFHVHEAGFEQLPVVSHTFSAPIGDVIIYGMTASGQTLSFGIGSVAGVWLGAFFGSLVKGHFRWEACEDPRELRRQIIGAALMGVGAVIAMGCSIGQGLSAFSLLAFSAPVTFAAIFAGAAVGLRQLIVGFAPVSS